LALSESEARQVVTELLDIRARERERLDHIHSYLYTDRYREPQGRRRRPSWLIPSVPDEIKKLAEFSRVDMLPYIVRAAYQSLYVEGFRRPRADQNEPSWIAWQRNQMDARQIGIHKAALGYGKAYATVLPSDTQDGVPVIRGASPRKLTTAWGDDDMFPEFALEKVGTGKRWRLIDNTHVYWFEGDVDGIHRVEFIASGVHGITWGGEPVCPVILYRETNDLDEPVIGLVEPLMDLQDQINFTTFSLMVAQHFGAFKQRAIAGWIPESEQERVRASAERLWTFLNENMKFFEFSETDLEGYLKSREASYRNLATIAQQSPYELLGTLTNLSADALALADASRQRAAVEYSKVLGEAHEQMLGLAGQQMGVEYDPTAEIRWQDTSVQTLAQFVDALGKAAQMLEIPPRALWEPFADKIGASQTEVERWERIRREEGAVATINQIMGRLSRQRGTGTGGSNG
jgi:hypothetical protein